MTRIPERLRSTGSSAAASTIERDFARFWKFVEMLTHLVDGNVNRVWYRPGLLDLGWSADIDDHQRFRILNLRFQVGN